jgi:hypothetical protein
MTMLILAPVALLAIMLLLSFTGCTLDRTGLLEGTGWDYDGDVLSIPSLAGYWRMGEVTGPTANDQTAANHGSYETATLAENPAGQSPGTTGTTNFGAAGMVTSEPVHTSVEVDGGYIEVPFSADLNTATFTLEIWVFPTWPDGELLTGGAAPFRSVMASREVVGGNTRGFTLYAGPDASVPGDTTMRWQIWVGDGSADWQRLVGPPVEVGQITYLAATYDGTTLKLFVNGSEDDAGTADASMATGYVPCTSGPLYIGMGAPEAAAPLFPFKGRMQEAAIYNAAITSQKIDDHVFAGVTTGP